MLWEAEQLIDISLGVRCFSWKVYAIPDVALSQLCPGAQVRAVTPIVLPVSSNQIKRWGSDDMWAFGFLGHPHTTKTKGKEKQKLLMWDEHILTSTFATLSFLTKTDPSAESFYFKYDVWVILFSVPATQESNALKARPRSRYCFHFFFRTRHTFLWC